MPSVAQATKILGAYKFLVMPKFDVRHLMREIEAILPKERNPKKEEHDCVNRNQTFR
jgi:hypothetical protein